MKSLVLAVVGVVVRSTEYVEVVVVVGVVVEVAVEVVVVRSITW